MFDFDDLDFLEEGLQRMEDLKTRLTARHDYARTLRYTAGALRKSSRQLVAESQDVRERLKQA